MSDDFVKELAELAEDTYLKVGKDKSIVIFQKIADAYLKVVEILKEQPEPIKGLQHWVKDK